jgi:glycerol-3-phosphate dehydrogenase
VERDFERLRGGPFDLLVIGGGIYGAWTAYDAVLRGLRVALVEKHDWAAGTSSSSSKLIHGGLRYLRYLRLGQVRKGLHERRRLQRLGPHRVRPLRFVLPLYSGSVGRLKLKAGLWLYDRLAGRERILERHCSLSRAEVLERYDFLDPAGLRGGFTFGDCQTDDARFTLEIVDGAVEAGAVAVNRAAATELLVDGGRVVGAHVADVESDDSLDVRAEVTVNCAGAWSEPLVAAHRPQGSRLTRLSKGVHLVMPPLPTERGFLLVSRSHGHVVFMIPWYGRTLLGTTDSDYEGPPEEARVEESDIAYLLEQANAVLGKGSWEVSDAVSSFVGLRTLPVTRHGASASVTREWSVEEPLPQLFMSVGGKYTSARVDAGFLVHRVASRLGREYVPCPTTELDLPWKPEDRFGSWFARMLERGLSVGVDEATAQCCLYRYGLRVDRLFDMVEKLPRLAGRIVPDATFCLGELVYTAKYEMARSLEDVFVRRVPLMRISPPPLDRLRLAAQVMGKILGWSDERKQREVASLAPQSPPALVTDERQ